MSYANCPYESRIILTDGLNEYSIKERLWPHVLELAKEYRWEPMGTLAPEESDDEEWGGNYREPCEQRVSKQDAHNLACALEGALCFLPDDRAWREEPYCYFCGCRAKQELQELISFLRQSSGFAITGPIQVKRERWQSNADL
jgi:hypothetical protein